MIATIVLSILIFGACFKIVYSTVKKGSSCEDCQQTDCAVKGFELAKQTVTPAQLPPHLSHLKK